MQDTFYLRLDFYRRLEGGGADLVQIADELGVEVKTLHRWQNSYDPARGPFVSPKSDPSRPPTRPDGLREDILAALRRVALDGNVPAAKLLLTEYVDPAPAAEEEVTVETVARLIREWHKEQNEAT
jgi:transposase